MKTKIVWSQEMLDKLKKEVNENMPKEIIERLAKEIFEYHYRKQLRNKK